MGIKNMIKLHKTTEIKNLKSGDTFMYNNRPHIRLSTYDSDLKKVAKPYIDDSYIFVADIITGEILTLNMYKQVEPVSLVLTEDLTIVNS